MAEKLQALHKHLMSAKLEKDVDLQQLLHHSLLTLLWVRIRVLHSILRKIYLIVFSKDFDYVKFFLEPEFLTKNY